MKLLVKIRELSLKAIDWLLVEPKRLCRLLILSICCVIVIFQLWECVKKLLHPPISTYSHFDLNKTIYYPAVTVCREPAFKVTVLHKYNLSINPAITSAWRNFPFDTATMSEVYEEATYSRTDLLNYYFLKGNRSFVDIEESLHFSLGKCFTLKPKVSSNFPNKNSGYSISLSHDFINDDEDSINRENPGFHIYIHEPTEKFTEHAVISSGRVEYLFLLLNEVMELKLTAQHFSQYRGRGGSCSDDALKSSSICNEICRWKQVEDVVSCSGPWMTTSQTPECHNFNDVSKLIINYQAMSDFDETSCGCVDPCDSVIYSAFVINRRPLYQPHPGSLVYIYFSSKLVTKVEERAGYDSSQFVADMGGSLGFLLGLSVIGIITVLEIMLGFMFLNRFAEYYKKKRIVMKENDGNEKSNEV